MRNLALADLTAEDLASMLSENETLFVEHKGGLERAAAKAVCSFANALGGWVLIGVTNGAPNEGEPDGWRPVSAAEMTDRVRECLKAHGVDPIPAFAATVPSFCVVGRRVGVIRVYESDDAPHVMGNGQVFVRGVAQDENRQRVYRAGGVETQAVLISLLERGRRSVVQAHDRFTAPRTPFVVQELGFRQRPSSPPTPPDGGVMLRAAPVTHARLEDWAISRAAHDALAVATREMVRADAGAEVQSVLNVSGLAAHITADVRIETSWATTPGHGPHVIREPVRRTQASCVADAAGIVGASMMWGHQQPPRDPIRMTLSEFRDVVLTPVLIAVCNILSQGEMHGRSILQLSLGNLDQLVTFDEHGDDESRRVPQLPLGGMISLPLDADRTGLNDLANQWRDDIGRAVGYERFRR